MTETTTTLLDDRVQVLPAVTDKDAVGRADTVSAEVSLGDTIQGNEEQQESAPSADSLIVRTRPGIKRDLIYKSKLSEGGLADIYLAETGKETCVVKVLKPEHKPDLFTLEREVLHHSMGHRKRVNTAEIYDYGRDPKSGEFYIVMEYLEGKDLADLMVDGPNSIPLSEKLRIMEGTAENLHVLHTNGIIHRDVKPENIVVGDKIYLLDFGLARVGVTAPNPKGISVEGTLGYIPPEIWIPQPHDEKGDQFSLGAVMYEMLTGITPVPQEFGITGYLRMQHIGYELAPDTRLPNLVMRCLHIVPGMRYSSCGEVAAELNEIRHSL